MNKKLTTNIFYNLVNQLVTMIVPLLLAPYVARILSAELIGDYAFSLANSSYFVLIEDLGLSLYGMLKVAANRDDKKYVSQLLFDIMALKVVLMLICCAIYFVIFIAGPYNNRTLNSIMILNIVSTGIDTTWFLMGYEEFKITALRNSFVRVINVALVIILVKSVDDFLVYAWIMQISNVLSYLLIIPITLKRVTFVSVSIKSMLIHLRSSLVYFVPGLINTIFTSTDKTILGYCTNSYQVGIYEQATKITTLCGSVISSVSNVILPRLTYLNNSKEVTKANELLYKTVRYSLVVAIAISLGLISVSDVFVNVFYGPGYEGCSILIRILSWNVVMTVLSNYIGQQCLISKGKQKEYNIAISVGAIINVILNIALVRTFSSIGVSIASCISGALIILLCIFYSKKDISLRMLVEMSWKSIVAGAIMVLINSFVKISIVPLVNLILHVMLGGFTFIILLIFLKEDLAIAICSKLQHRT